MAFRGYFALNGVEIANSSRVAAHLGLEPPTTDAGILGQALDCSMVPVGPDRLLAELAPSQAPIAPGRLLSNPADGSRLYSPLLALVGDCWSPENMCFGCGSSITYDDSWPGLADMLGDTTYRPELAPWYSTQVPQSAEFGGIWVMDVKGLDAATTQRDITESAGDGGSAAASRVASRRIQFDALLVACTNAGLNHGLQWLKDKLMSTADRRDSTLRYLVAHPGHSAANPADLVRELHGVVMTQAPNITAVMNTSKAENSQATVYRVSWELTATLPHAYAPALELDVEWDTIATMPIRWVHASDCRQPVACQPMPALFAEDCTIDRIEVVNTPPPTCGGCMPVCAVQSYHYDVPTYRRPFRTRETAVSMEITNTGTTNLTLQGEWRRRGTLPGIDRVTIGLGCTDVHWPIQVTSLPPTATLVLDGITRSYHVVLNAQKRRPYGIVATPDGRPWKPPVIDRSEGWEFVVLAPGGATFDVSMDLLDREV